MLQKHSELGHCLGGHYRDTLELCTAGTLVLGIGQRDSQQDTADVGSCQALPPFNFAKEHASSFSALKDTPVPP